jgi:predicted outer membrane repeat protein
MYQLLTSCFVLAAYGSDLGPPPGICSAPDALTNVCAYQTPQVTAKVTVGLVGFANRPVWPGRPRNYSQEPSTPLVQLATSPRPSPLLTDSIDVQRNPNLCTNHADPTRNICSTEDEPVLIRNEMIHPAGHDADTSDIEKFMKRLLSNGPKKDAKPRKWWMLTPEQKRIWIIATKKDVPANMHGNGPELSYAMTRTCTTPAYHSNIPPPTPLPLLSFCCELLYVVTLVLISMLLVVSTACAFGLAKAFDKLSGVKIPCRELLFVFLTLFPAPGAAVTQVLADQSSIQVAVHTNASASTTMFTVDTVTSWAQLVTACAAPSANITLSSTFKMGAYTDEIDVGGKVIIIFGSNAILDAGKKGRFFIGDGSKAKTSLELHGITLKNGKADANNGGAIYINKGSLVVRDSTFATNTAGYGGVIYAYDADVKIYASTFESNTAAFGGAISADSSANVKINVRVHDTVFQNNIASRFYSGAIYVQQEGNLVIHDSTFATNTAYRGGAIFATGGANVEIHGSTFQSNAAGSSYGGAIWIYGSLAAFNCTFHGNTAAAGGAVFVWDGATATFTGCIFNGNNDTKGHNDITRHDGTSNVTFACANGTAGAPVTMKAGESEVLNPPPVSLKCTASRYVCQRPGTASGQCVVVPTGGVSLKDCVEACT